MQLVWDRTPRSVYVHVPFCEHRCGYCNFAIVAGRDDLVPRYLEAIRRELANQAPRQRIRTLFFGGGTPSQLPPESLIQLIELVTDRFQFDSDYEFSIELNPGDVSKDLVTVLTDHGINRASLGVQSFNDQKLRSLDRCHRSTQVYRAYERLRQALPNISIDLMFGAPREPLSVWLSDLEATLRLRPDHVSSYGLTYEKGTRFWTLKNRGGLNQVPEERERAMYCSAIERLGECGYEHYEVSNFAQSARRCRHNEAYWEGETFFGFGPGAARYLAGNRALNHRSPTTYIKKVLAGENPTAESECLDPEDRAREAFVFGMRRTVGIDKQRFQRQTGFDVDRLVGPEVRKHVARGFLVDTASGVRLTRAGLLVSDSLWPEYLRV